MIYFLLGNDITKKNNYLKTLTKDCEIFLLNNNFLCKELINEYACNVGLFGQSRVVVGENVISKSDILFTQNEIISLANSKTIFVFFEDKLLFQEQKNYKKYATILNFEEKKNFKKFQTSTFSIADAFASNDKIKSWILYRQAIERGVEPEAISGVLFWKIKTMILSGNRFFSLNKLKLQSSNIVSLYHKAHRGECDFVIGLEQFILSSLSK